MARRIRPPTARWCAGHLRCHVKFRKGVVRQFERKNAGAGVSLEQGREIGHAQCETLENPQMEDALLNSNFPKAQLS